MPRDIDEPQHPVLPEEEDRRQRGEAPPGSIGHTETPAGDLEPGWTPGDGLRRAAEGLIKEIGGDHRPRREDVYPYLLIRAHSSGDRGARPVWPPTAFCHSPDLLLVDAAHTGAFDPAFLVGTPTAGRRYRVFVRVWNLGLLPAIGVHVRAWYVDPGFFGGDPTNPAYQPRLIGGAMVDLEDRTRPGAVQVVELDTTWDIPATLTGHECLLASASCPLDQWSGALDGNNDRHVGQRNLTILAGAQSAKPLIALLGAKVTRAGTLEIRHGGLAVAPLLRAVLGEATSEFGPVERLRGPSADRLRHGVPAGTTQHLMTMFATDGGWLVADSARVRAVAAQLGLVDEEGSLRERELAQQGRADQTTEVEQGRPVQRRSGREEKGGPDEKDADGRRGGNPFAEPLGARRLIETIGVERVEAFGILVDAPPEVALLEGLARLWGLEDLTAAGLAAGLTAGGPYAHLLELVHTDNERDEVGGYALTVVG